SPLAVGVASRMLKSEPLADFALAPASDRCGVSTIWFRVLSRTLESEESTSSSGLLDRSRFEATALMLRRLCRAALDMLVSMSLSPASTTFLTTAVGGFLGFVEGP